ncbi:MAG: sigma-70 family RNA polymerase sigma factor [Planctomycetales bacterium]|nr:sigma-70 family RNA polymerase sigma factor [Planctomycetales bacterium]
METNSATEPHVPPGGPQFATTQWSLVVAASEADAAVSQQALAELCQAYWLPVYVYVRRRTPDVHTAQDLTQAFFERLLEQRLVEAADPARGRFRSFLLTACQHFLVNQWQKNQAAKRGGGQQPLSLDFDSGESRLSGLATVDDNPERLFQQQWAVTLLARVLQRLADEWTAKGKQLAFEQLKQFLTGAPDPASNRQVAEELNMSESAVKVAVHRLRDRYRQQLRAEIAATVATPEDVDDEIRNLFEVLG